MGGAHDCENLGFCLPACFLLEFRWQKADQMCTCTRCLPTFWAAPSNFSLPALEAILKKTFPACIGSSYLSSLSLKQHIRIKHVRSAYWVAPTNMPQGCFFSFLFEGVSQLHGINMSPRDISYLFEGVGA
jgi:hypothetical protein